MNGVPSGVVGHIGILNVPDLETLERARGSFGSAHTVVIHGQQTTAEEPSEPEIPGEEEEESMPEDTVDALLCVVCRERKRTTVIRDCKHSCLCVTCARAVMSREPKCPMCRKLIVKGIDKIFIS